MIAEIETLPAANVQVEEKVDPNRWFALVVVLLAAFMDLIDTTVVNIAVPAIQHELGATYSAIQWILAGYQIAFALVLITGGRLGDIFGRKRMFLLGVTGFTLASAISGFAQSPDMLIASRLLQGAMAAIMIPQVLSIIQVSFPARERGAAFGMYGAIAGLAAVSGPIVGGLLIQWNLFNLDWRPIFLVNIPVGVLALFAAWKVVTESKATHALKLDLPGVVIITAGLLLLIYPLVQGRDLGWPAWTYVSMGAAVPVLALFALYERYKTRKDGSPLVELSLFKRRQFLAGLVVMLLFFAGVSSFFLVYTLYLQIGLGFSALHAGVTGLPFSIATAVASGLSIQLAPRFGRKIISLGMVLMAAGMLILVGTIQLAGTGITSWHLIPSMLVSGLGMGIVIAPLSDIILAGVPHRDAGSASGVLSTINQIGGAMGVAVIGVIFFGLLGNQADPSANAVTPQIRSGLQSAGVPSYVQDGVVQGFKSCFHDRMTATDPFSEPESCKQAQSQGQQTDPAAAEMGKKIGEAVTPAATQALKLSFSSAAESTNWYEAALFALTFLLVFFLPHKPRHEEYAG
jgi:EmrB/QacA subfamily drug resistance transporter